MPDENASPSILPSHIDATIRAVAQLHAEHHEKATLPERAIGRLTAVLGRPWFLGLLSVMVIGWIGGNLLAAVLHFGPVDPPPFAWLGEAASLVSLYTVVLILATQQREDRLARQRELLTLELAILTEQKTAKVIELLEEVRRDNPLIRDRDDREARAMARPADPQSVLEAIKETHATADMSGGATP